MLREYPKSYVYIMDVSENSGRFSPKKIIHYLINRVV